MSVGKVHHQIRLRILSCGRMSENHRGPEVPEVRVPVVECLDGLARITLEEVAITHFVDKRAVAVLKKGNWQERESVSDGCHDRRGKPGKRGDEKLGQNSSERQFFDARQLGCVFQDMKPPKSVLRKGTDMPRPIQRVKVTKAIARHTKIRDQSSSLGKICPGEPHERIPTLRNLRIVHKKRQSGKSKVPAKQRGSWPKMCLN